MRSALTQPLETTLRPTIPGLWDAPYRKRDFNTASNPHRQDLEGRHRWPRKKRHRYRQSTLTMFANSLFLDQAMPWSANRLAETGFWSWHAQPVGVHRRKFFVPTPRGRGP